jgi:molecular chaperone HscB
MTDYFSLLGLPRKYQVDLAELERRYLELSREVHPDRAGAAAAGQAMSANQAYRTLKRELSRAEHLLALEDVRIGDNEPVPQALLGEMLELREELDEARRLGDRAALDRLEREAKRRERSELDRLSVLFDELEGDGDRASVLQDIRAQVVALRYTARYREAFEDAA